MISIAKYLYFQLAIPLIVYKHLKKSLFCLKLSNPLMERKVAIDRLVCTLLLFIQFMSSQVSINICKILNWCLTNCNIKLQVAFYTLRSHNYLAHKSAVGYFNSQTLTLNTSFRINYQPSEHIIICKISDLRDKANAQVIGQIEIDLNLLADRKALFLPFQDHDKVLEVRIYEAKKDSKIQSQKSPNDNTEERREQFLQQRFDFLDKLTQHETQLKKKFSEKVYNLLKQLKSKNHQSKNEPPNKSHIEKQSKSKNQVEFRNRLNQKKKSEYFLEPRNTKLSPAKNKYDHELLIHSVHAKAEHRVQPLEQHRIKTVDPVKSHANNPAFGGIISPHHNY